MTVTRDEFVGIQGGLGALRVRGVDIPNSAQWAKIYAFKGLDPKYAMNIRTEANALHKSIYWDWFQTVRLSRVVWYSHARNVLPRDRALSTVCKDFRPAFDSGVFVDWAMKFARALFAEAKNFDLVSVYDPEDPPTNLELGDYLVLAIPLTVPRIYLLPQILNYLGKFHAGRNLDVLKTAHTATYKLHTLRFRRHVLEAERLVYVYRTLYPEVPLWVIADRLQLAPSNAVRDDRFTGAKKAVVNRLNSVAGRHLYKAKRRIRNVERGSFPNCEEVASSSRARPFGRALHDDFIQSTGLDEAQESEWKNWLRDHHHRWLIEEVLRRNHLSVEGVNLNSVIPFLRGDRDSVELGH